MTALQFADLIGAAFIIAASLGAIISTAREYGADFTRTMKGH